MAENWKENKALAYFCNLNDFAALEATATGQLSEYEANLAESENYRSDLIFTLTGTLSVYFKESTVVCVSITNNVFQ